MTLLLICLGVILLAITAAFAVIGFACVMLALALIRAIGDEFTPGPKPGEVGV